MLIIINEKNAQSRKTNEGANQLAAPLRMCQRGLDDVKEFKVL